MSKVSEPFADYADFDDCVAKNQDKEDPEAYCAVIKRQVEGEKLEKLRHYDFDKIRDQFIKQCGEEEGCERYQEWLNKLGLDETISYLANQSMREKFSWIRKHVDFNLWKEDQDAKYWRVEVAFPLESMNNNVYTLEELQLAARTIKGKPVNLNHKFNLPTVEILAGEYEDNIAECVIRVPNQLYCPICDKDKTINDLIGSGEIVNVSLESACDYGTGPHGECQGMNFTRLALLTKNVLPGIPLTRLMPLESIMVEALQTSTEKKPKVKKVEMKIKEQDNQPDAKGQCPEGQIWNGELGQCVKDTSCPEGQHWDENEQKCVDDMEAEPEEVETQQGTSVEKSVLEADYPWDQCIADQMKQYGDEDKAKKVCAAIKNRTISHAMAFGLAKTEKEAIQYVADKIDKDKLFSYELEKFVKGQDQLNIISMKAATEKVQRIKAETKAKSLEEQVAELEKDNLTLEKDNQQFQGKNMEQSKTIERLEKQIDGYNVKKVEDEVKLKDMQRRIEDLTISRDDYKQQLEKLQANHEEQTKKYHTTLSTDLELSRKLTTANEDYLTIAKERDSLKEALNRAKIHSKKIIRIKA